MEFITIKKGNHYSRWFPYLTTKKVISGIVRFRGDFSYKIEKQKDTNKLIGLSNAWHHHKSSVRIGWRWNEKENGLDIMVIIYDNYKRTINKLCFIPEEALVVNRFRRKTFCFSIAFDKAYFNENDICTVCFNDVLMSFEISRYRFIRYKLFPYFGGTTKAPFDFYFNFKFF